MHYKRFAAALLFTVPALAAAQSSVTIYGVADAAIASEDNGPSRNTVINSGNQSSSRIGFRGTEDLGYGLKALFNIEAGVAIDTGAGDPAGLFQRRAVVGVQHAYGTLTIGREYSPIASIAAATDILGQGFYGSNLSSFGTNPAFPRLTRRLANSVNIKSTPWRGFALLAAYSAAPGGNEPVSPAPSNNLKGVAVEYANGPFYFGGGFHVLKRLPTGDDKEYALGAGFTFNQFDIKANGLIADQEGPDNRFQQYNLGASMTMGPNKFFLNGQHNKLPGIKGNSFAIAYSYNLSKRTNLYASYAKIWNDNSAFFGI
ncbi:MAG TPA: porin, partial [Telluria sp.]